MWNPPAETTSNASAVRNKIDRGFWINSPPQVGQLTSSCIPAAYTRIKRTLAITASSVFGFRFTLCRGLALDLLPRLVEPRSSSHKLLQDSVHAFWTQDYVA